MDDELYIEDDFDFENLESRRIRLEDSVNFYSYEYSALSRACKIPTADLRMAELSLFSAVRAIAEYRNLARSSEVVNKEIANSMREFIPFYDLAMAITQ